MEITFFIGNGFDLQCGLKSRYIDIYDAYKRDKGNEEIGRLMCSHFLNPTENWCDFEEGIYKNANKFEDIGLLRSCVEDFREYIKQYLKAEDERIIKIIDAIDKNVIVKRMAYSLDNYWKYLPPNDSRFISTISRLNTNVNFISLNYTNTLKSIIDKSYIIGSMPPNLLAGKFILGKVVQAHGTYNDGLVMGADNDSQFNSLGIVLNKSDSRALTKTSFIKSFDDRNIKIANNVLINTDILCIYGASLGDSDISWRDKIVNWLKTNDKAHIVKCYKPNEKRRHFDDSRTLDQEEESKISFLKTLGIEEEEIDSLIDRVHIPLDQCIFDFMDGYE